MAVGETCLKRSRSHAANQVHTKAEEHLGNERGKMSYDLINLVCALCDILFHGLDKTPG